MGYKDQEADEEPATAKQIRRMRQLKLTFISGLTKRAAYLMIKSEMKAFRERRKK